MATTATPSEAPPADRTGGGRARVHESALRLFAEFGVSGTSLQMIADDMGVTKAAVYYHYRTKDEIVLGVIRPFIEKIAEHVERAAKLRSRRAQVEAVIDGIVDVIVDARGIYVIATHDKSVAHLLQHDDALRVMTERLVAVTTGPAPTVEERMRALVFLSGLTGPVSDPVCAALPDDELRRILVDTGRRLLLVRR